LQSLLENRTPESQTKRKGPDSNPEGSKQLKMDIWEGLSRGRGEFRKDPMCWREKS